MWYTISVYDINWKEVEKKQLNEKIFNDKNINHSLIHEFVVMQFANKRYNIAHTKTRWEVAYSGRKLYRQKWTGRARVWDAGSPIRRHGWVAFGPRNNRNFHKDMPKKQRRKALFWSLTLKAQSNNIVWLDKFDFDNIKTKNAVSVLKNLSLEGVKTLVVIPEKEEIIYKSFSNIPTTKTILSNYINPLDLLTYKKILFVWNSLEKIEETFLGK